MINNEKLKVDPLPCNDFSNYTTLKQFYTIFALMKSNLFCLHEIFCTSLITNHNELSLTIDKI